MSSSLLSHQIKGGIERLVSIVDAERPPDTPPGLRLLDFDYSSQSGFEVLRGALGAGGEVVIAVSALDIPADDPRQLLGLEERWRKAGCRIIWVLPPNNRTFFINGAYASLGRTSDWRGSADSSTSSWRSSPASPPRSSSTSGVARNVNTRSRSASSKITLLLA